MPLHFSHSFCITSPHFMPLLCIPSLFPASLHSTSLHLPFCPPNFTPLNSTLLRLMFCLPHFTPTSCHFTSPLVLFALLHATSHHFTFHFVCLTTRHFMSLHFASSSFCLTSCHFILLHFTSILFASLRLTSSHLSTHNANFTIFAKDSDIRKIQLWRIFEIIFTFAKDSDIQKIRIGESFEYLSYLQKIRTFKQFDSNCFPNLSNVLNILLTSLFLQKIQIFERFSSGESLK